jgi:uncharacterized membrane protein
MGIAPPPGPPPLDGVKLYRRRVLLIAFSCPRTCMTFFRYLVTSGHLFGWAFALIAIVFMPFPWDTRLITALIVTALGIAASLVGYRRVRRRPPARRGSGRR